jgi:hypothetical protein
LVASSVSGWRLWYRDNADEAESIIETPSEDLVQLSSKFSGAAVGGQDTLGAMLGMMASTQHDLGEYKENPSDPRIRRHDMS